MMPSWDKDQFGAAILQNFYMQKNWAIVIDMYTAKLHNYISLHATMQSVQCIVRKAQHTLDCDVQTELSSHCSQYWVAAVRHSTQAWFSEGNAGQTSQASALLCRFLYWGFNCMSRKPSCSRTTVLGRCNLNSRPDPPPLVRCYEN